MASHPELLAEYVASARLDDLVRTITCGNVGLEGALIVPSSLYDAVAARVVDSRPPPSDWQQASNWKREVFPFLARRCDEDSLRAFIARAPEVVDEVFKIGLYLSAHTSERRLARVLLDLNLATDEHRTHLVETLTDYAVDGVDGSFLDDEQWLEFFSPAELRELDRRVLEELDALDDRIAEDLSNSEGDASSADESVKGYESRFPGNPHVAAARRRIEQFTNREPDADSDAWRDDESEQSPPAEPPSRQRSIFDDLAR